MYSFFFVSPTSGLLFLLLLYWLLRLCWKLEQNRSHYFSVDTIVDGEFTFIRFKIQMIVWSAFSPQNKSNKTLCKLSIDHLRPYFFTICTHTMGKKTLFLCSSGVRRFFSDFVRSVPIVSIVFCRLDSHEVGRNCDVIRRMALTTFHSP